MLRDKMIRVRLSEKEYEELEVLASKEKDTNLKNGDTNLSAFARKKIFIVSGSARDMKKELGDLQFQIRKIGVNINQVVKRINSGYEKENDDTYLLTELAAIEERFHAMIELIEEKSNGSDKAS